jgi:hypothetical protein
VIQWEKFNILIKFMSHRNEVSNRLFQAVEGRFI